MVKKRELEYNLTIGEAWSLFEEDKRAQGIVANYKEVQKMFDVMGLCESDYVSVISEEMINRYTLELRGQNLSISSINHYLRSAKVPHL